MILSQSQAAAVYAAMCALNNVSARALVHFGDAAEKGINVYENEAGVYVVRIEKFDAQDIEEHATQAAFAAAYGLN